MISLLKSEKFTDGRNILNFSVMAITELKLLKINGTDQLLAGVTFDDTVTTN